MKILEAILPVVILISLGVLCRRTKMLREEGVAQIKKLVSSIFLPVLIVNALGSADYSIKTALTVLLVLSLYIGAMLVGFLLRPLAGKRAGHLLPIVTGSSEGGMFGYPLFIILVGAQNLKYLVTVDIAAAVFAFSVWCVVVMQIDSGEKKKPLDILMMAVKNPCVWGVALGILLGATGAMSALLQSPVGGVYTAVTDMITQPLSALILICLGYDLTLKLDTLWDSLRLLALRIAVQAALLGVAWLVIGRNAEPMMQIAMIFFFCQPASFVAPVYAQKEENRKILSAFSSLNALFTVVVFAVMAVVLN